MRQQVSATSAWLRNAFRAIITVMALLTGLTLQAFALDAQDFANQLNRAYAKLNGQISYSAADIEGTTIILRDAALTSRNAPSIPTGDMTFESVSALPDGGYRVETAFIPDLDLSQQDASLSIKGFAIDGLVIPGGTDEQGGSFGYDEIRSGPIRLANSDDELFSIAETRTRLNETDDGTRYETDFVAADVSINLTTLDNPQTRDAFQKMGYSAFTGNITGSVNWTPATGRVDIEEYAFDIDEFGRVSLSADISGYTREFIESVREMQAIQEQINPNDPQAQQAAGLALIGVMQQLTFSSAKIRFDDASGTARILSYAGNRQGLSGDQMAQAVKEMAPLMLAALQNAELQEQITSAISAFVDDPKTLMISAMPENPVPFALILGAAMTAPQSLPQILGLAVTANE